MVNGKMKHTADKLIAGLVTTAMSITLLPNVMGNAAVLAASTKNQDNTGFGVAQIKNPTAPEDKDSAWAGNYVYFGWYGDPIKFRVLQKDSTAYTSGKALFLDSNGVLFYTPFDDTDPSSNSWNDSDIRSILNDPKGILLKYFTDLEKSAIATSTGNGGLTYDSFGTHFFGSPVSVNDQVFLLDVSEVMNPAYGYSSDSGYIDDDDDWSNGYKGWQDVSNRVKMIGGLPEYWCLRSIYPDSGDWSGGVFEGGYLGYIGVWQSMGISPALNVDQSQILFSTLVGGTAGQDGAEYKLTLFDSNLSVSIPKGKQPAVDGDSVTIPYDVSGDPNRVSVLILDKEYADENANDASILYYDALDYTGTFGFSATGLDIVDWGTSYYVYVVAETENGTYETDYASQPVKVDAAKFTVVFEDDDGTEISSNEYVYGTAADDVTKPADPTKDPDAQYTYTFDKWTPAIADVTEDATYTATYTTETNTYTVKFANYDGTVLESKTLAYGVTPSYSGITPTRAFDAQYTYTFKEWSPALTTVTGNVTYTATFEATPITYEIVSGGDSTWKQGDQDIVITVKRSVDDEHCINHFDWVANDGTKLTDKECTVKSGSTVITLKSDYLKTLSAGEHTIIINFDDASLTTKLTVKEAASVPSTGEDQSPAVYLGTVLILIALGTACGVAVMKHKDNGKRRVRKVKI